MSVRGWNNSLSMRRKSMAITAQDPSASSKSVAATPAGKGISCSTPEPSREAGSPCDSDSDAASPVPFLCTQDGSYGDTEVVWNYDTPHRVQRRRPAPAASPAAATPLSSKQRNRHKSKICRVPQPKQRPAREAPRKTPLFQDLLQELNKNIQGILEKSQKPVDSKEESASEEDMFCSSPERSPRAEGFPRSSSRCLRKNLLSSKFSRPEPDTALESDDSMNECLMRASQMIEERVFCDKRNAGDEGRDMSMKKARIEQDSMDDLFNDIKFDSPVMNGKKVGNGLINDSFDNFVENLNDSAIERLTQLPIINESPRHHVVVSKGQTGHFTNNNIKVETCDAPTLTSRRNSSGWTIKELIALDSVPSGVAGRSSFSRHSSMPESPSACAAAHPSCGGTTLSRHSSMPHGRPDRSAGTSSDDSTPIRCTPDEIKRKHQQAREKLLAKRLFPNACSQKTQECSVDRPPATAPKFQHRMPTRNAIRQEMSSNKAELGTVRDRKQNSEIVTVQNCENINVNANGSDLKSIIEKKRKEALMKLKMKRSLVP